MFFVFCFDVDINERNLIKKLIVPLNVCLIKLFLMQCKCNVNSSGDQLKNNNNNLYKIRPIFHNEINRYLRKCM